MKILGGNQVVFYSSKSGSYQVQLEDCLVQLEDYMDEYQIYPGSFIRHNIFVDFDGYEKIQAEKERLEVIAKRRFPMPLIINVIPQKPAEGKVALETTHIKSTQWNCLFKEIKGGACQHIVSPKDEIVIGAIQIDKPRDFQLSVEKAFEGMDKLLSQCNMSFNNVVKQWSYIERMYDSEFKVERYQIFNDLRTKYYEDYFNETGYPASTEVGISSGGIIIEFMAIKNVEGQSKLLNNPVQKAPYEYSLDVLSERGIFDRSRPTTPKVERARYMTLSEHSMAFISATPAVVGERVMAIGDVNEQAIVIIENLKKLTKISNLSDAGISSVVAGKYSLVKAYVQNTKDFDSVYDTLEGYFGEIPMVLVQAELPRKDILVEVEAELFF